MAANRWTFRNYNAVLRVFKKEGLSHRDAQAAYRSARDSLNRPVRAVDLKVNRGLVTEIVEETRRPQAITIPDTLPAEEVVDRWNTIWDETVDIDMVTEEFEGTDEYEED